MYKYLSNGVYYIYISLSILEFKSKMLGTDMLMFKNVFVIL